VSDALRSAKSKVGTGRNASSWTSNLFDLTLMTSSNMQFLERRPEYEAVVRGE